MHGGRETNSNHSTYNSQMNTTIVDRDDGPNESYTAAAVVAADGPPSFVFVTPKTKAATTSALWRPPLPSSRQRPQYPHLLADTPATAPTSYPYLLDAASFDTDDDDILQGLQELADYQDEDDEEEEADGRSQGHHHHHHEYLTNLPPTTPTFPNAPRIRHRWQPRHRRNSSDMSSIDMPDLTINEASLPLPPDNNNDNMRRGSYSTSATSLSSSIEESSSSPNKQQTSTATTSTTTPGSRSSSCTISNTTTPRSSSSSSDNNISNKFKRMSLHQFVTANPSAILSVQANTRLNW
jgi:hypothetical protein